MPKFLIEVPHDPGMAECISAVEIFLKTGSHFLAHADWGCKDGDHRAWIVAEVDSRDEARLIVPSVFRPHARIVQLNTFTMSEIEELRRSHPAPG